MAIIALKQKVTILKKGEEDLFGNESNNEVVELRCRVDDVIETVKNNEGKEVVSKALIWLDKYPNVTYNDTIIYEDEHGNRIETKPLKIRPIRHINAKPLITQVYV